MPQLLVPGRPDPLLLAAPPPGGRFLDARVRAAVAVSRDRAGGGETVLDVAPDDVIELTLEDDVTWLTTYDRLRDDVRWQRVRGDAAAADGDVLMLGPVLRMGPPTRGAGGLLLKIVRVLGFDLPRAAAREIAARLEGQLRPGSGLYHCPDPARLAPLPDPARLAGPAPSLLLLHGTASSTAGSFGGLTEGTDGPWAALRRTYGERTFAFEHPTLSRSPLANAVDLVEALPTGARLHLVSHSRGGLVGEILARAHSAGPAFTDDDLGVFARAGGGRDGDLAAMRRLNELFDEKRPRVERFVRAACPAAGTTLASGRIDVYFNVLFNVLKRIPFLRGTLVFDFVADFLKAVVRERMDPTSLPGLEAMMPTSPLVRVLNDPAHHIETDLAVIAGDVEPTGFVRRLLVLAADLFYRSDHDLVVHTPSMLAGTPRRTAPRFLLDRGGAVDHFHYFLNPRTRRALTDALAGRTGDGTGFRPVTAADVPTVAASARSQSAPTRPVVFLVPGLMGSTLDAGGAHVWPDRWQLAQGGMARLDPDAEDVEAVGLVGAAYGDLAAALARTHHVVPFPYDWRRSFTRAADALADRLRAMLDATEQPVRFVAHGTGGYVLRALAARRPGLWAEARARAGCRVVLLGAPGDGTYDAPELLLGRHPAARTLAVLDLRHDAADLLARLARFPGLLELLPVAGGYFEPDTWEALRAGYDGPWTTPDADALAAARAVRAEIDAAAPDPATTWYVAGRADATPAGHARVVDAEGRARIAFFAVAAGDGRVTWADAVPPALRRTGRVWYADLPHGALATHPDGIAALADLLLHGATTRLAAAHPDTAEPPERFETPDVPAPRYPDEPALLTAVLGLPAPVLAPDAVRAAVEVSVTHGDLAYGRHPVLVGHFEGDGIVSTERALDHHLGGRLAALLAVGLYPGPLGTAEVVIAEGGTPPGAVVAGLGAPGALTPGGLARTCEHATLVFAQRWHEHTRTRGGGAPPRLTSVLVGSGYGGLGLHTAVHAVLNGVERANRRIEAARRSGGEGPRPIAAVEFVERYEDRAVQALHALIDLADGDGLEGFAVAPRVLRTARGGLRAAFERPEADWDTRLQVRERPTAHPGELPALQFTALTERARAEDERLPVQRRALDRLIRRAVGDYAWDERLAQTLFELLLPNEFKPYAADRRSIIWVLDHEAAAYPWELLHDVGRGEREPLAVRAGMVRQLATGTYRRDAQPALTRRALVVGEPALEPDAGFAPLPGAAAEARDVAARLAAGGYDATSLVGAPDDEIIVGLFAAPYRILHLAGHGVFERGADGAVRAGLVIGRDTLVTPAMIEQMRQVPEVVFVNCCHLGAVDARAERETADRNRLAANLGTQLIEMGVRAVVVAGWAVQDDAAALFARRFYDALLGGACFRDAVREARAAVYRRHADTTTWGAYQCYGHPYFTLHDAGTRGPARPPRYAAPVEAVVALENFTRTAEAAARRDDPALADTLARLVEAVRAHPDWAGRSDVAEALADAYHALDRLPEALAHYETLVAAGAGTCSTGALERLGALQIRLGVQRAAADGADDAERRRGDALVRAGLGRLERLFALDPTHARRLHLAGAHKRIARMRGAAGDDPLPDLRRAADGYRAAFESVRADRGDTDHYALLNWLMLEAVAGWRDRHETPDPAERAQHAAWIARARAEADEADARAPDFWNASAEAADLLLRIVDPHPRTPDDAADDEAATYADAAEARIDAHGERFVDAYVRAWRRGGAFDVRRTVLDELDFHAALLALGPDEAADTDKRRARRTLTRFLDDARRRLGDVMVKGEG